MSIVQTRSTTEHQQGIIEPRGTHRLTSSFASDFSSMPADKNQNDAERTAVAADKLKIVMNEIGDGDNDRKKTEIKQALAGEMWCCYFNI